MSFIPGYCTASYADKINTSSEWASLLVEEKDFAIVMGRQYIDGKYLCKNSSDWDTDDETTIPEEIKWANAFLAEQYALGTLTSTKIQPSGVITRKKVKAGSVESDTTYAGNNSIKAAIKIDPFPEITLIIGSYCSLGAGTENLIRV